MALSTSDRNKYAKQTELLAAETVRYQAEIKGLREERDLSASQLATMSGEVATLKNDADSAVVQLAAVRDSEAEAVRKATLLENNVDGLNKEIDRLKEEHNAALAEVTETINTVQAESDAATSTSEETALQVETVSYTHLTLPTNPYV